MAKAWFDAGWPYAARDLEGPGARFVISPYVTTAALQLGLKAGDRLLLQGTAQNFLHNASKLEVVEGLMRLGVEVRREARVHAKVYMRHFDGGAVGWLGSANLTQNGRSAGSQVEAMSGPFWLDRDFLEQTENLWDVAQPLDICQVELEVQELEQKLLDGPPEDAVRALVAVHVTFNAGLGRCTLRPRWLGITARGDNWRGVTFPTVPYLRPEAVGKYRLWKQQALDELVSGGGYSLGDGIYLFRTSQKNQVEVLLTQLRQHLLNEAGKEFEDTSALRAEFKHRFNEVLLEFANKKNLELVDENRQMGREEAFGQFDEYMSNKPFELSFSFFVPLLGGQDEALVQAIKQLQAQPYQSSLPL